MVGKIWRKLFGQESYIRKFGSFRDQERYGLINRPNYLYGILRAADVAKYFGKKTVTIAEFGVASGNGLLNMVDMADLVERETGIKFRILGFDTGAGLPAVKGHKDHPEIWSSGDFAMVDKQTLMDKTRNRAEIVLGDIGQTITAFTESLSPDAPLGFASIDVDIYSGAVSALKCLLAKPEALTPAVSLYFDDVGFYFANEWCGELAAIQEFNEANKDRKIGLDRSLPGSRPGFHAWYKHMYVCHVLDHPSRNAPRTREQLTIPAHHAFMKASNLY